MSSACVGLRAHPFMLQQHYGQIRLLGELTSSVLFFGVDHV
jgi:hypothetical protein